MWLERGTRLMKSSLLEVVRSFRVLVTTKTEGLRERPAAVDARFVRTHAHGRHSDAEWRTVVAGRKRRPASPRLDWRSGSRPVARRRNGHATRPRART